MKSADKPLEEDVEPDSITFLGKLTNLMNYLSKKDNKNFAFTLAEMLVVIGIIGVVSTLTIPNLSNKTNVQQTVTKLEQTYLTVNSAQKQAIAKYGPLDTWFSGIQTDQKACSELYINRVSEFLKIKKNCGFAVNTGCFTDAYIKTRTKADAAKKSNMETSDTYYKIILENGASASFYLSVGTCKGNPLNAEATQDTTIDSPMRGKLCGHLYIDIDGPNKGPYAYANDVFLFWITQAGIFPYGSKNDQYYSLTESRASCFKEGQSCAAWVLRNRNMDYLKVGSSGYCNGIGGTLSWEHTRCR